MKRAVLVASAPLLFAIGCGSGPTPASPSPATPGSAARLITASPSPALFGASTVDFARCLQAAADAGCFAAGRVQLRGVGGASATAPSAPMNLSTSSSGGTVMLTWSAPASGDPVTTYVVEAGSAPGLANLANFTTNSTLRSFSATGVGNGTYYVRVRAQSAGGTSEASNESILVVGLAGCSSPPGAPGGLTIAASGSTVTLAWSAPAGGCAPTSYVLQAGFAAGASDLANSNVGNTTSYVAIGVGNGTYYVRVRAANAYGESAASNEFTLLVRVTTPTPTPTPGPGTVVWSIYFYGSGGLNVSACTQGLSFCGQVLNVDASGAFHEVWSPSTPNVLRADGTMTATGVVATLQCVATSASGSFSASASGSEYAGTATLSGKTVPIRVVKGFGPCQ